MGLRILNNRVVRHFWEDETFRIASKVLGTTLVILSMVDLWHEGVLGFLQSIFYISLILSGVGFLGSLVVVIIRGAELNGRRRWERD